MPTQPDILCLGEPMVEFVRVGEDGGAPLYRQGFGGDTSNAAIAAARQGAKVGYITALGADPFGDALTALWAREGIDTSHITRRDDAATGIYFADPNPTGHSFTYYRAGSAASRMSPSDLPAAYIAGAKVLHVSAISQAISESAAATVVAAIDIARRHDVTVSYDTNLRLRLWPLERARATIHAAMRRIDIALPSYDDAAALTGERDADAIIDFYLGLGARIVALKLGAAGARVATERERRTIPALPVTAVDATGAGDAFAGAFLASWLESGDPFGAGGRACAVAALTVAGYGAVDPIPRRDAVDALLQSSTVRL
jgi:2-dehydro-3-deoxygluconokinase